jgi:glycosyltransferase involved in cell wall biosynthesis
LATVNAPQTPLVSVVTPSFNMARYLRQTIESVLSQDYPRIEYIVADGGSTDGSIDLLESFGERLRFFTGKDTGAADAIHKGLLQAHGEIFAWLNADDTYLPGAIRTAAEFLASHPEVDAVYGEAYWVGEDGAVISRYPTLPYDARELERDCFICQPALFLRASAYRRCALDPEIKRSFDYDLWIRMAKLNLRFASIPQYLANSRMHTSAKTFAERNDVFHDSMQLLSRHYGYVPFSWVLAYTAYCLDGRDQFFEPFRPSVWKYLASLPMGLRYNPGRPFRYLGEWLSVPFDAVRRRLRSPAGLH